MNFTRNGICEEKKMKSKFKKYQNETNTHTINDHTIVVCVFIHNRYMYSIQTILLFGNCKNEINAISNAL